MIMTFSFNDTVVSFYTEPDCLEIVMEGPNGITNVILSAEEAYYLRQLLKNYPDPMILEDNLAGL